MNPSGQLIVTGYPRLFATSPAGYQLTTATCQIGTAAGQLPIRISYQDAQWLNGLADEINGIVAANVSDANTLLANSGHAIRVTFVATSPAFNNHRLCSGSRWFNGVEVAYPVGKPQRKRVSLHPNADGQKAYASAVIPKVTI